MVYERIAGPLGPARGAHHAAMLAAVIANVSGKRRYGTADFLPRWGEGLDAGDDTGGSGEPQSPEQMLAIVRGLTRALGGEVHEHPQTVDG